MKMSETPRPFTAVVLAADRGSPDPVAAAAGVSCKAMTPVLGDPMLFRVIRALQGSHAVSAIVLCGPPRSIVRQDRQLAQFIESERIEWVDSRETPSTSAAAALTHAAAAFPVLITTADHALLTPDMVDHFCHHARRTSADVLAALASYRQVMQAFPGVRRTATRFRDGPFCSCNLFAVMNARGRKAVEFWRRVERERKTPWKMINQLGWFVVLKYLLGALTLAEGLERTSKMLALRAGAVAMPYPEAAVDVDTPSDWQFVENLARRQSIGKEDDL
jgi:CTP:molybdopterin cytidylyltransferase MocA